MNAPGADRAFAESLHHTGFAVLRNPPLDLAALPAVYQEWREFFGGPSKHGYLAQDGAQHGYFPALPDDQKAGRDHKEYFHVGPSGSYPEAVSGAARAYLQRGLELAERLLSAAQAHLPPHTASGLTAPLDRMLDAVNGSLVRVQHYLPLEQVEHAAHERALAHRDLNLLTLLPAPSGPGLQVQDVTGRWHDIPVAANGLVVNAGEMLEQATGGFYPAALHRVVAGGPGSAGESRLSLPLFVQPSGDALLAGEPAHSFLRRRVAELAEKGWRAAPGGPLSRS
jgi:isopenicillin N synthase-like dioxygenase